MPTDAGYQLYAEHLLEQPLGRRAAAGRPVDGVRNEVDSALRTTTEMLSHVTSLLALVTAPPLETTEIRHVEVLVLQPQVVMVVVITSTGGVTKRIFPFDSAVDPKLAEWAGAFLNEQLAGVRLGGRMLQKRLDDPGLSPREREFLTALPPAFTELVWEGSRACTWAARPGSWRRCGSPTSTRSTTWCGCSRAGWGCWRCCARRSTRRGRTCASAPITSIPHMRGLAMVAANYGLATRNLGTVSLIGPMRMDYALAIRSVRGAAALLSEWVADIYEE